MNDALDKTFIIETQFDLYLKKSGLSQDRMSDVQYIETRRAFYAGFGQMILMIVGKIADLPDDDGAKVLDGILNEVTVFYSKEENI